MYYIIGTTNYECTEGEDQLLGCFRDVPFIEVLKAFKEMLFNKKAVDFSELDEMVNGWIEEPDWEQSYYYDGFYGGSVQLWAAPKELSSIDDLYSNNMTRFLLSATRMRDPYTKEITLYNAEWQEDIMEEERALAMEILEKIDDPHLSSPIC